MKHIERGVGSISANSKSMVQTVCVGGASSNEDVTQNAINYSRPLRYRPLVAAKEFRITLDSMVFIIQ